MINRLLFLVIIFLLAVVAYSAPIDEKMKDANALYQNNQFSDAILIYESILEQDYESASLHYNLGNSYFRIGQIGEAILNYEKGLKIDPDDEDLKYNLKIVQARTVDKIQDVPQIGLVNFWVSILTSLSISGWAAIVVVVYLLLLLSIAVYFLSRNIRLQRISFFWGIFNLLLLVVIVFIFIAAINRETSTDYGVIINETVTVKVSPNEKSEDAFVIHEGLKFAIEDKLQEWTRIKLSDGKSGWLPGSVFKEI
jgi:tetratricopeptide (TPR) repeat protein